MFKKKICRLVSSLILLMIVLLPCSAFAEIKDITAIGEYNMGESETLIVAKDRAVYIAMQNAVEQAGVYIESYTRVVNSSVSKDEINMIASGIIEVADKKFDRKMNDTGGDFIKVTITCKVNTDNVQSMMNKLHDNTTVDNLKKVQSDYEKAMQENIVLKQQLAHAKTEQEKQRVEVKITQNEQSFTATQWFEKGNDYQGKKDFNNAIVAYNNAIELNPQEAKIYNNRGLVYSSKGQDEVALADFNKAIELNPLEAMFYCNRALVYLWRGHISIDKSQYDVAFADFNKAIELNPQLINPYFGRGLAYLSQGQYNVALADFNKAIELNPQFGATYISRGNVYQSQGQYYLAFADFNKAIELNPEYESGYINRGEIYRSEGQYDLALTDFNKAIELNPHRTDAYYSRGNSYLSKGQYEVAIADFNRIIELDPQHAYAYYEKGTSLSQLGRIKEAIECYYKFIQYAKPGDQLIEKGKQRIRELGGTI